MTTAATQALRAVAPAQAAGRATSAAFRLEATTAADRVRALEPEWRALADRSNGAILFQTADWCLNHLAHCESERSAGRAPEFHPVVVTVRDAGGRLVGLLPLAIQRNKGARVLTGFGEPFQQYTEILLDPSVDVAALSAPFVACLRNLEADYLHLGQVRSDGALARLVADTVPMIGERDGAPCARLEAAGSIEDYWRTIATKTRKNLRNLRNRLERAGTVEHVVAAEGALVGEVVARSFAGREAWLERQGLTSRAFRDEGFSRFIARFAEPGGTGVEVLAFSLTLDGKPVADQWGFVHRGRYYAFMSCWDLEFEQFSPGRLHLAEIVRECGSRGFGAVDMMIPAVPYKLYLANEVAPVADHVMPLTALGHLHVRLWLGFLRPRLKAWLTALPEERRVRLLGVTRRLGG